MRYYKKNQKRGKNRFWKSIREMNERYEYLVKKREKRPVDKLQT